MAALEEPPADGPPDGAGADDDVSHRLILARGAGPGFQQVPGTNMLRAIHFRAQSGGHRPMYKEFFGEVVVWLIPVVILVGLAYMITQPA
ncbi:hypothetical protein GCM10023194_79610 [Planotetraspora phitsanulokensis]|uniref:Uncharacterized protein n=1 Tax=Planotetraspora phitsanulokensis TaxID=575192 RepID=A0A8J3UBC5_9ACTN|nr:hypothetical protein Pph01_67130 [Planotetraspora phitsanulokensis]